MARTNYTDRELDLLDDLVSIWSRNIKPARYSNEELYADFNDWIVRVQMYPGFDVSMIALGKSLRRLGMAERWRSGQARGYVMRSTRVPLLGSPQAPWGRIAAYALAEIGRLKASWYRIEELPLTITPKRLDPNPTARYLEELFKAGQYQMAVADGSTLVFIPGRG